MKRAALGWLVLSAWWVLMPQIAHAAGFKTSNGLGSGSINVPIAGGCADVSCASGHSCFCADGSIPFKATGGIGAGSAHVEMLMDNSTSTGNANGPCENTGGKVFFTAKNASNTLTFGLAGTYCETNRGNEAIDRGGYTILSGTGSFANAAGTGLFAFGGPGLNSFGSSVMQLQFTGNFNKTGASAATVANPGAAPDNRPSDQ
jgi:hypothetical protein